MQDLKQLFLTDEQVTVIQKALDLAGDMWAEAAVDLKANERSDFEDYMVGVQCEADLKVLDGIDAVLKTAQVSS